RILYPSGVFPPREVPPRDGILSFHALVPVVEIPPRKVPDHHYEVRRRYGEGKEGVRGLLDQLQGLQGHGRGDLWRLADRAVRDDEEDLGLCEAEEASLHEVIPARLRGVTGGSLSSRA